jgi:hypothetical protein
VCPNCGTEAGDGDRFCSAYGTALEPFCETARNSLRQHGGTIDQYVGDRSGWLLGGEAKEAAGRAFERLGATLPAD